MQQVRIATLAFAAALVGAGCSSTREEGEAATAVTVTVPAGGSGGQVTISVASCTSCHGDSARSAAGADPLVQIAPPRAPSGDPADPAIGAHQAHLVDNALSKAVACSSCHVVPASPAAHRGPVVTFSGLALSGAWSGAPAAPSFAGGSCSATYCHGAFPGGDAANAPQWTGAPAQCGSCHAIPPAVTASGSAHPQNQQCGACHAGYTSSTVAAATHVDGSLQISTLSCTSCHGDAARPGTDSAGQALAPAPPTDSTGATTSAAVGAHLRHLVSPLFSQPVACGECHGGAIPADAPANMAHADGVVQVAFGTLAATGGVAPAWAPATVTCSSTYCHGNFPGGAGANPIAWNAGSAAAACGTCHGFPPADAAHTPPNLTCDQCHPARTNGLPDAATHLNGVIDSH
jgi:predicted CxxxxCH...CXXCH cytochrome family protein